MPFRYEGEMLQPIIVWLSTRVTDVKCEFQTPWGYCDVVGCRLDTSRLLRRHALLKKKSIGSIARVGILWEIPETSSGESISLEALAGKFEPFLQYEKLERETETLISKGFVSKDSSGNMRREAGWFPLQQRLVAIELKLSRVSDVIDQASANLAFVDESYIATPMLVARRVMQHRLHELQTQGIGLIGVERSEATTLLPSEPTSSPDPVVQAHCVERFWQDSFIHSSA